MDPSEQLAKATPDTVMSELKKQGITSLEDLVRKSLDERKAMPSPDGMAYIFWHFIAVSW